MAFVSGSTTGGVYFDGADLTSRADSWTATLTSGVLETTNFGSTGDAQEYIRGIKTGSMSVGGFYDPDVDQELFDQITDSTARGLCVIPEAQAIGGRMYGGVAYEASFNIPASVGGVARFDLSMNGTIGGGRLLKVGTSAVTGVAAEASYDSGEVGGTANGGVWFINVFAANLTTMTCAVEDSANDSTWATFGSDTFTGVGSSGGIVSGQVDRYIRFNVTAFTGTSASVVAGLIRL